ncbi:LysR substrate-binding domain-containing protein [Streptomyces carpinensis]|uniref:LysR substrate-binding domain-containing protein n=1 Tax=Streptomyces carpinensis TaxID=66369 RepID=A0ABV1WCI3_9ACTN|nr:LysR substrate-binding domain-containing protein [Streptomyces carpinensis]
MFTLAQLTGFVAVAEELHFGRAAERLRMTQPPLSRQIQLLENDLQVRLLDRTNRAVRLTPAGRAFLVEARRLLKQADTATLSARRVAAGGAGNLAVGFTAAGAYAVLDSLLELIRDALPEVDVTLKEMVTRDQLEQLREGGLDLGLVRPPVTAVDLEARSALREPLLAALPLGHPLADDGGPLDLAAFDGQPVIMYSPVEARYFHDLLVSVFRAARVVPVYTQYLSQVHSILALVGGGWGIALVPAAASQLRYATVAFRPVELPGDPEPVELSLAWRRDNDNPALHALLGRISDGMTLRRSQPAPG